MDQQYIYNNFHITIIPEYKRDRFSVALYATEERSPEDEKLYARQNCGGKKKNNEANWMVSNSAKLDRRTKQHTQFGVSASSLMVPEIWPGQNRGRKKKKNKNNKANWMVSNSAKLDRRTKQHTQFGVSASNGSRDMARTNLWRKKRKS